MFQSSSLPRVQIFVNILDRCYESDVFNSAETILGLIGIVKVIVALINNTTTYGVMTSPPDCKLWIDLNYFQFPDLIFFTLPCHLQKVKKMVDKTCSTKKLTSKKFWISDSSIPYFATILRKDQTVRHLYLSSRFAIC